MTRAKPSTFQQNTAAAVLVAMLVGCASLNGPKESIVHVRASRNPAEAARLTLLGVKALDHGDVDRATAKFMAAVDADQSYGPAHNNIGLLHFEQGNLYQAVLAFEQAMELMPQDPAVYYNLGLTLETAGRVFEAMELYTQAVEMDPTNPYFLGNLVRLRIRMGEDNPILVTQLQDLILIETRPDWRRWADRQLALHFNPMLDRGPDTPEFDTGRDADRAKDDQRLQNNIIELSPQVEENVDGQQTSPRKSGNQPIVPPQVLLGPDGTINDSQLETLPAPRNREPDGSRPAPIRDNGSLESLPPSIRPGTGDSSLHPSDSRPR